ncbi:hypothetical protein FR819_16450 [Leclercia adecarboxylata]|nr:hypothetical protein FR819_16450 [Leclercia adecarboxylata]
MKTTHSETDKSWLQPEMDPLLAGLIALDRQAVRHGLPGLNPAKRKNICQQKAFIWYRATKRPAAGE